MARQSEPDDDGPEQDRPMSLGQHLDELRRRLVRSVVFTVLVACVCFYFQDDLVAVAMRPAADVVLKYQTSLLVTDITELFFTQFKVVLVAAVFLGGPFTLYQLWGFVATGLYEKERRSVRLFAVPSMLLFVAGVVFCYFVVQPLALEQLLTWELEALRTQKELPIEVKPRFQEVLSFFLGMSLVMGLIFELPLVMVFAQRIGVVDWRTYSGYRRHFIMGSLVLAAILTPTGDALTLGIVMVPVVVLFELGILVCRNIDPGRRKTPETS